EHSVGRVLAVYSALMVALAAIGVAVPPRERGRYQGFAGGTVAVAAIVGPALGGLLVDHASWRWIFLLHVPLGLAALGLGWEGRDHTWGSPHVVAALGGGAL